MKTPGRSLFTFALAFALPLLLASCGGDGEGSAIDGAVVSDGQTGIDVRTVDASTIDARPPGQCVQSVCGANGSDKRCDDLDQCNNVCGGAGGSSCSQGFVCQTDVCTCNVLSCGSLGFGRRCVANNTGAVAEPGGAITLCTNKCATVGWPPCSSGYECIGNVCERMINP